METNKEKVMRLHNTLPDWKDDKDLAELAYCALSNGDFYWDYGENEAEVDISMAIDDYQVIRSVVLLMKEIYLVYKDGTEEATEMYYDEYEAFRETLDEDRIDEIDRNIEMDMDCSIEGVFAETWINMRTKEIVCLEHVTEEGRLFVDGTTWREAETSFNSMYMCETSAHEMLVKAGYNGAMEDDFEAGEFFSEYTDKFENFYLDLLSANSNTLYVYKLGGFRLLNEVKCKGSEFLAALKIARRNHYFPEDSKMYMDYLKLLRNEKKDMHNAYYVCPEDLTAAHDNMLRLFNKHEEKRRQEAERIRLENELERLRTEAGKNKNYINRMRKYLDLHFVADGIDIQPLRSIQEFYEEGKAMHHCVFGCSYYEKKNTLIFSAKDQEGNRLATIEYNTKDNYIVQCRACCNKVPERDEEIRNLIMSHVGEIKSLTSAKKKQYRQNIAA